MTKPQQPEIARSGRGEVDPSAAKTRRGGPTDSTPPAGAVPEENLPGHHPDHDQDKPEGPPPRPRARRAAATATATKTRPQQVEGEATATIADLGSARRRRPDVNERFRFQFEPRVSPLSFVLGITPMTAHAHVRDGQFHVHFGPWRMCTSLDNIEGAEVTGPYRWLKVAGPPHISLKDRGLTMATSTEQGVCVRFREPVAALLPKGLLKHPALTVTVEDAERLAQVLNQAARGT